MFVLMQSVWQTGFFQATELFAQAETGGILGTLAASILVSQLISNVPLMALYLPIMMQQDASPAMLMVFAAGSTIAGNMIIRGAASNVIIVQNAEKRGGITIGFCEFARLGITLTLMQAIIYGAALALMP